MSQLEDNIENNTKLPAQQKNKPNETTPEDNEVNGAGPLATLDGVEMSSRKDKTE
jgi:hypothetical protein